MTHEITVRPLKAGSQNITSAILSYSQEKGKLFTINTIKTLEIISKINNYFILLGGEEIKLFFNLKIKVFQSFYGFYKKNVPFSWLYERMALVIF